MSKAAMMDIAERAIRTFIQVFLGLYVPVILGADSLNGLIDLTMADKAAAAGVAAVLASIMGALGTRTGSSGDDASVL